MYHARVPMTFYAQSEHPASRTSATDSPCKFFLLIYSIVVSAQGVCTLGIALLRKASPVNDLDGCARTCLRFAGAAAVNTLPYHRTTYLL